MTPKQKEALDALEKHGSMRAASKALGINYKSFRDRIEAAKKYFETDDGIRDALAQTGISTIAAKSGWRRIRDPETGSFNSVYWSLPKDEPEDLLEKVNAAFDGLTSIYVPPPVSLDGDHLTVYPLYDMHIGMMAWGRETRGHDFDLKLMKSDLLRSIAKVMARSPDSGEAVIVLGGDTIHVNDHFNETPASRHHMDADGRFEKIIDVAIEAISAAIEMVAQKHAKVKIIVLRGNHDETSHIVLKAALRQRYRETPHIEFPLIPLWDKSEIQWFSFGDVLVVLHHGDKMKPERLALIVADKCPEWSGKTCRVILTGHIHTFKVLDLPGATHYSLRAFCPPDAYGANFGGVRGLAAMTFDKKDGLVVSAHDPIHRDTP